MRLLLQRVTSASVTVDGRTIGSIGRGYLLFIGVLHDDTDAQGKWLSEKVTKLRLFEGKDGTVNDRSLLDINGEILVVSQFTLAGKTEKGNRPDYMAAAKPDKALALYASFIGHLRSLGVRNVATGEFGAHMEVALVNDGPVTLILER